MKILIATDTHLGLKQSNKQYMDITSLFFHDICGYAMDHKIDTFIHAGDFFDNRKHITIDLIDVVDDIAHGLNRTFENSYMIVGNHDTFYKDTMTPTSLSMLRKYENIKIVDNPVGLIECGILLLPWLFNSGILQTSKLPICIGHFEMNGITLNSKGSVSQNHRLNVSDFNKFDMVLSGHYHRPGIYKNIKYLGSPYQMTFADIDDVKGFYVLDTDTKDIEFIPWDKYPKHIRCNETDKIKNIKGNIVELTFLKDHGVADNTVIINSYKELEPFRLIVKLYNQDSFTEEENNDIIDAIDIMELMESYYKKSDTPDHLKIDILLKIIEKLYKGIGDE